MYRYLKQTIIVFTLLFFIQSPFVHAAESDPRLRASILEQLQVLLTQVKTLQEKLVQLQKGEVRGASYSQDDLYPTRFYNGPFESAYRISGTHLQPLLSNYVRTGDERVFDTLVSIAGADFVDAHISEFRIFNDPDNELSGFVDQKGGGDWIVGINRFDANLATDYNTQDVVEILLHEYGHIVFFEEVHVAVDFKDTFWNTRLMKNHEQALEVIDDFSEKLEYSDDFYEDHKTMFVTAYAASSPEEDVVESFITFLRTPRPDASSIKNQKVRFFYEYPALKEIRNRTRMLNLIPN